jgi:hypothetical protein
MGWMPVNPQVRDVMGLPNEAADADRERKIQLAQQGQTSQEMQGIAQRESAEDIAKRQNEAAIQQAQIHAAAVVEAARLRRGMAAGGSVKNEHPFNKSFDNKLLMKGRR